MLEGALSQAWWSIMVGLVKDGDWGGAGPEVGAGTGSTSTLFLYNLMLAALLLGQPLEVECAGEMPAGV